MDPADERGKRRDAWELLRRIPENVSATVERFFYRLGLDIAGHPVKWIFGSTVVVLLCLFGLLRFRQEKNPLKLWIPPDSDFVRDTEWLMTNFLEGQQVETVILTGDDVLEPRALLQLNAITKRLLAMQTSTRPEVAWTDVCLRVPIISFDNRRSRRDAVDDDFFDEEPSARMNATTFDPAVDMPTDLYCKIFNELPRGCLLLSILDIWDFDSDLIRNQTKNEIIERLDNAETSPTLGHPINFTELLGGVTRDRSGKVMSAKAVKTQWFLRVNYTDIRMNESGNDVGTADWTTIEVMNWESEYIRELERSSRSLDSPDVAAANGQRLKIYYRAGRSWGDISASTMLQDAGKLLSGILLMSIYVQVILSRFNWVEWRFCLTSVGLLCVGGAFVVAIGLCSLFGVPYGPVHTSLPFMLMGLGVDDIFVMMASWDQVLSYEPNRSRPLTERVAMMLSHAGAAIFVTSFTDVVAFIIGASTILPSLQSFCIYAAVGVMMNFLLQVTFFVAFFALDVRRVESKRNGVIPCVVHENYQPTVVDGSRRVSWRFIDFLYSRLFLTTPGKVAIVLVTLGLSSVGIHGSCRLEQWFDPEWFLPKGTYLSDYLAVKNEHFPGQGHPASVFIGDVVYHREFARIITLTESLRNMTVIDRVKPWPEDFAEFVKTHYAKDLTKISIDPRDFNGYLSKFLFSRGGGKYQANFRFAGKLECGTEAPKILVSVIDFTFATFDGPGQWIPAMDDAKRLASESGIDGFVTVWSRAFASWVTDRVIADEVTRNLVLALVCVMATTGLLIAEPQTCFWILTCVLLTLVDVCGFMYHWSMTIDIVSCIGLELAVGLSVDYAAHVAHAFLNTESPPDAADTRKSRCLTAVRHIGAAVTYGAGSTLLSQSPMAFSDAYVFRSFFKIFFLVIVFGIWHGLVFLPVVLSTIGPRSLRRTKHRNGTEPSEKYAEEVGVPLSKETNDQ